MTPSITWFIAIALAASFNAEQAHAGAVRIPAAPGTVEIVGKCIVEILPSQPPPSRTELHFDCVPGSGCDKTSVGMEVSWDPEARGGLGRSVVLGAGKWQVSLIATPFTQPNGNGGVANLAWTSGNLSGGTPTYTFSVTTASSPAPTISLRRFDIPKNAIASDIIGLLAADQAPPTALPSLAGRSLGLVPNTGIELLDMLGSIVVRKAGAAAQQLIRERIVDTLCGTTELELPGFGKKKLQALVPRSCRVLSTIDIFNLASTGKGLMRAIAEDGGRLLVGLAAVALHDLQQSDTVKDVLDALSGVVVPILEGRPVKADDARRLMMKLASVMSDTSKLDTLLTELGVQKPDDVKAKIGLAIATAAYCGGTGECTPERMRAIAATLDGSMLDDRVLTFADRIYRAFFGSAESPRQMLDEALVLLLDAIELDKDLKTRLASVSDYIALLRVAASGDLLATIAALTPLLDKVPDDQKAEVTKWLRIIGAVAGVVALFVEPDGTGPDAAADRQARREAQETAVEQLIDTLSSREGAKAGELMVSFGGTLRGGMTHWHGDQKALEARPSLSFGVGFDLPFSDDHAIGFHADLGVLDIGNYLRPKPSEGDAEDESSGVEAWDLVDLSATAGFYFVSHELPMYVSGTIGYVPSVESAYYGFQLGVWVPFFTF